MCDVWCVKCWPHSGALPAVGWNKCGFDRSSAAEFTFAQIACVSKQVYFKPLSQLVLMLLHVSVVNYSHLQDAASVQHTCSVVHRFFKTIIKCKVFIHFSAITYEGWNFNFGNSPLDWIQELLEWRANAAGRMGPSPTYIHNGSGPSRNGHTQ